jgi:hypothetical protein
MTPDRDEHHDYLGLRPAERYTSARNGEDQVVLDLDGERLTARVLGRNGPRVQVSVLVDGRRYTRWVDATSVVAPDVAS